MSPTLTDILRSILVGKSFVDNQSNSDREGDPYIIENIYSGSSGHRMVVKYKDGEEVDFLLANAFKDVFVESKEFFSRSSPKCKDIEYQLGFDGKEDEENTSKGHPGF